MTTAQDLADHYDDLQAERSVPVTYARAGDSVPLSPLPGTTLFEHYDTRGTLQTFHSRDFLIQASELILAASLTEPQPGDKITEVAGGVTHTYEVLRARDGEAWRFSDELRSIMRVHSKRISVA